MPTIVLLNVSDLYIHVHIDVVNLSNHVVFHSNETHIQILKHDPNANYVTPDSIRNQ